jgi:Fungal Zn(2)-Cys(6) binuclear cluster domain/Fungal specific transcription factor domain
MISYGEAMDVHTEALQACLYCKQRKRKCDKQLPSCFLCTEKHVICDYSASNLTSNHTPSKDQVSHATDHERLAAAHFLDSTYWAQSGLRLPPASAPLSREIMSFIGDPWQVAEQWFRETSSWLPILSIKHFRDKVLQPLSAMPADTLLLLASMKVITWAPSGDSSARTTAYIATKRCHQEAQLMGVLSVPLLQAMVILALYEIGHAIYPAAYLSIGSCARYGMAIGVDGANATDINDRQLSLFEQEERRRLWWVIVIIDRYMNLSCPTRSLSTKDPAPEDLLPTDDEPWERAFVDLQQMFTASSPADVRMGSFARLCQSTYLLSRVLAWRADTGSNEHFKEEQRQQLDRTLHSLINLSLYEGRVRRMTICAQTAVSYSALIILHSPSFLESDISVQPITMERHINLEKREALGILRPAAEATSLKSGAFLTPATGPRTTSQTSPLLLHWAYLAASVYIQLIQTSGVDEEIGPLEILKTKLKLMSKRWLVAGMQGREIIH